MKGSQAWLQRKPLRPRLVRSQCRTRATACRQKPMGTRLVELSDGRHAERPDLYVPVFLKVPISCNRGRTLGTTTSVNKWSIHQMHPPAVEPGEPRRTSCNSACNLQWFQVSVLCFGGPCPAMQPQVRPDRPRSTICSDLAWSRITRAAQPCCGAGVRDRGIACVAEAGARGQRERPLDVGDVRPVGLTLKKTASVRAGSNGNRRSTRRLD